MSGVSVGIGNWSGLVGIGAWSWDGGDTKETPVWILLSVLAKLGGITSGLIWGEIVFELFVFVGSGLESGGAIFWSKNDAGLLLKLRLFVNVWESDVCGECLNAFEEISLTSAEGVRLWIGWKWFELGGRTMSGWMLPMDEFMLNASLINAFVFGGDAIYLRKSKYEWTNLFLDKFKLK